MDRVWSYGAASEEDVTGYAEETQSDNSIFHEIDRFMMALQRFMPEVYRALIARHLRVVPERTDYRMTEQRMAWQLYGQRNATAYLQFCQDCAVGYISLQIRLLLGCC